MNTYTIFFEIRGKKLKTDIMALSEERAKDILRNKIIFHKIQIKQEPVIGKPNNASESFIKDFFGF